ncbi:MAG: 50S ribosomal protein L1, partial [Chloroflexi bacterium]|nr:50S ribosomal protein L1 [Chloroflexota bacterium]
MPAKHSKRFRAAVDELEDARFYTPAEAVELVKKTASAKFDETVEIHLRTNADPRHADQQLRGVATLPHGLGKNVRVAVFAAGEAVRAATDAGAEIVGADDLVERIEGGFLDFDVTIATPDLMGKIGKLGRILGRRGLMPNPRTGTVVQPNDIA